MRSSVFVGQWFGVLQAFLADMTNFQGFWLDDVAKVFKCIAEEATLPDLKCYAGRFKGGEYFIKVGDMVFDDVGLYIKQVFLLNMNKLRSNARQKAFGALVRPNSILKHLYVPECHVNVVLCRSSGLIGICQYSEKASKEQKTLARPIESINSSILGMG